MRIDDIEDSLRHKKAQEAQKLEFGVQALACGPKTRDYSQKADSELLYFCVFVPFCGS
jgi:hypothetical protein